MTSITAIEKLSLFDQAKQVHRLVHQMLLLSAELVNQVEDLQRQVAELRNARNRV